jgi:hypothetical protein
MYVRVWPGQAMRDDLATLWNNFLRTHVLPYERLHKKTPLTN